MAGRRAVRAAAIGLLAGSVAVLPSCADSPPSAKPEELGALWRTVEARLPAYAPPFLWQRRETPLLPLEWPPTAKSSWARHAFAYGFDPTGISDGVRVAAPYAVLRLDAAGSVIAIEPSPGGGRELGIQGVQPTNPPSGAIDGEEIRRIEALAISLREAPAAGSREESSLVSYYGRWLTREAVIAGAVRPAHTEFFDWIESRRGAGSGGS